MKYSRKHIVEYALLRTVAGVVNLLPYRAALCIGWFIAAIAFYVCQFRKAETIRRMQLVFGDRYALREYHHMAWINCRNLAFHVIEILRSEKATQKWCNQVFDAEEAFAVLKRQADSGKGGIIATPHMGNWDLAAIAIAQNEIPMLSIVARQRNPLINGYFDRMRSAPCLKSLTRGDPGVLKAIVRNLREGSMFGILPDARMKTSDLEMPFLGGTANLGGGMASFARMTGVPIFLIVVTREGWAKHRIRIFPAVEPDMTLDKKTDVHRMTAIVLEHIEREIRATPAQWFWYNKRWILDPVSIPQGKTKRDIT